MMKLMKSVGNASQGRLIHGVTALNRDVELPGLAFIAQICGPGDLDVVF